MKRILLMISAVLLSAIPMFGITADEIIRKLEENRSGSIESVSSFIVNNNEKKMHAYQDANGDMLVEFTNPEEKGRKILRLNNEIYLYYPKAEEVVHLQGEALKDSVLGSDFSYEDLTGGKSILDKYDASLGENEVIDNNDCYVITLSAKKKNVVYPKEVFWIDMKVFNYRKGEFYAKSGKLVKRMTVSAFMNVSGKTVPSYMEMSDVLKTGSKTVYKLVSMKTGIKIDDKIFQLEELSW